MRTVRSIPGNIGNGEGVGLTEEQVRWWASSVQPHGGVLTFLTNMLNDTIRFDDDDGLGLAIVAYWNGTLRPYGHEHQLTVRIDPILEREEG